MTRNASKLVIRLSNYGILVSFCALLVASAIDIVPDKQIILEVFFYCFFSLFLISLAIRVTMIFCRTSVPASGAQGSELIDIVSLI